jgi:MFS family permease
LKFVLPPALTVLHNRDFRLYWFGQAISLSGTWMQVMAQGWVVTALSASATMLGALNVASTLPMLLLAAVGGLLADRFEKRRILIATQIGMMILAFVFAALVFTEHIGLWQIFLLAFLLGIVAAFDLPAAQAFPPELVRRDEIQKAVALMQAIFHGSRLVGPAIAGVLVGSYGEGSVFLLNGLSFVAVIATLVAIPDRPPAAAGAPPRGHGGFTAGFRYVRKHRLVGSLIGLTCLTTTFVFPFIAVLMAFYVRHVLNGGAQSLGALMSASGLGALGGAIACLFGSDRTVRRWLVLGVLGCTLGILGLSAVNDLSPAIGCILVLSFSVSSLMGRIAQTIQHVLPNELRGRVMAVFTMAFTGIMPYAALALAALADGIGFARVLQLCSVAYALTAAVVLLRVPQPTTASTTAAEPAAAS